MASLPLRVLTTEAFKKYGRILLPSSEEKKLNKAFLVLEKAESDGWGMAYFEVSARETDTIHNHPNTKETFEPIQGVAAIAVAPHGKPLSVEVFLLDKPVVVNKGIWHSTIALSEKTCMRINENLHVETEKYSLPFTIKPELLTQEKTQ
ncbi:MAG: hypothetical protein NWF14_02330 [Candidatus Bathyarchaeota archaeon]|nr:hypothetical protein [Candidatus Bathyarchaeota archaeon]